MDDQTRCGAINDRALEKIQKIPGPDQHFIDVVSAAMGLDAVFQFDGPLGFRPGEQRRLAFQPPDTLRQNVLDDQFVNRRSLIVTLSLTVIGVPWGA